ncbi:carbohydrate kinase [Aurantimonas sp. 22II-16-19i]|uniref:carbohydrate kinase family protein n=1 Tax=Aurantimonas sp. 22II-16-19i TaxID=1317114 RepID=UPI0009F7F63D|nr:carbohydrate kinase [Aurantimonas sp. 22II-16-19i]ORE91663.1 fructokinase [Aurantimonas sp. 22II-16-19i]
MFLSCGDCLFDLFAVPQEDVATVGLAGRVGGSPLNVALGLARLGHHAGYFTKMSGDLFGERIRGFMERERIDQRFLIPTDRNTTLAMVSLAADGSASYAFYIDGTADRSIAPEEVPQSLPAEVEVVHVASYSTVTEPTASALLKLVRQEAPNRFVSYDPNVRASIEPDLDVWRAKVAALVPFAALVKASEEDIAQLYPGRAVESVIAEWVAAGAEIAVATLGEHGAIAQTAKGVAARVPGQQVAVVDTVGAGDTFQAALLAGLKERDALSRAAITGFAGRDVEALLGFAVKAAAVTCTRKGADLPRRADLGLAPLA